MVEGGSISAVGPALSCPEDALVIDASGKLVIPGGVDTAVHLHSPKEEVVGQADDFSSGTRAALQGGTTTVVELVESGAEQSIIDAFNNWKEDAENNACCDYAFR